MISSELVKVLVWVLMDGTMVDNRKYIENSIKRRIQWKLSKSRKIDDLCKLLSSLNIPHTVRSATMSTYNVLQPYYIRIYGDWGRKIFELLDGKKDFPEWMMKKDKDYVDAIMSTIKITDGYKFYRRIIWGTSNPQHLDFMKRFCELNEIIYSRHKDYFPAKGFNKKPQMKLSILYD